MFNCITFYNLDPPNRNYKIPHFNLFRFDQLDGYGDVAIATHVTLKVRNIDIHLNLIQTFARYKIDVFGIEILTILIPPLMNLFLLSPQ